MAACFGIPIRVNMTSLTPDSPAPDLATLVRELLPETTRLVALHFQQTVVRRALTRLQSGQAEREPLRELASARLEVAWR